MLTDEQKRWIAEVIRERDEFQVLTQKRGGTVSKLIIRGWKTDGDWFKVYKMWELPEGNHKALIKEVEDYIRACGKFVGETIEVK